MIATVARKISIRANPECPSWSTTWTATRPEESGSMNRGAPYTVLYTFHVSLLVRQARPIRYHHLADLVPRSHLGITVVVLAAIHVVDRRSPLYLLDKSLRVKHVPRFSPFLRSFVRFSTFCFPSQSRTFCGETSGVYIWKSFRDRSRKSRFVTQRLTMEGQSFIRRCVKEKSLEEVELEESRKRSIGDQRSIRRVKQLFRHTCDSPIDWYGQRKGSNGTAAGGPRPCASNVRVTSRHVASSAAACASLRRNRCTASTALVSWRPGKCGCGCGAESMPPATLPDQRIGRAARGSRAGWKTAESRRRATPVRHVDCRRDIRVQEGFFFFRVLRLIKLLSWRLSSSYSSNKAQTRD